MYRSVRSHRVATWSRVIRCLVALAFAVATGSAAAPVLAQGAPPNDDFDSATAVTALPFTSSVDTTTATTAPDDPTSCGAGGSVWYALTPPQNEVIGADTIGSNFPTALAVYTGVRGNLTQLRCNNFSGSQATVNFNASAGTTYFFMLSSAFAGIGGGNLVFNVRMIPPPANDNFLDAARITGLPFQTTQEMTAATLEPGEPTPSCSLGSPLAGSVWYSFTPTTSGSLTTTANSLDASVFAVYTGTSISALTETRCSLSGGVVTFHTDAGTTYYFQTGGVLDQTSPITFSLQVAPLPTAGFLFLPFDPSIFDTVQFIDLSSDPGQVAFASETWVFGDGATGTGSRPTHRYAADGDYTAKLTVATLDGRTASSTQVVTVRTHDVAVSHLAVPSSGRVGRTSLITAQVSDTRYPETVQVQLFKSDPSSPDAFLLVGTLTQSIPARPRSRTTPFAFSYTFTSDDGVVGKVTFKAVATIIGARDALPSDNTAIATTTKVTS